MHPAEEHVLGFALFRLVRKRGEKKKDFLKKAEGDLTISVSAGADPSSST